MKEFTPRGYLDFLGKLERMKSVPRHSITVEGVKESVAAHSWRLAVMAYLLKNEVDDDVDIDKVIRMCLLHDIGEAVTNDIPSFNKTDEDRETEDKAVDQLLRLLPDRLYREFSELFGEMEERKTKEARMYKALDNMEAVIQHNESDISTWLPLEYELQQTYGMDTAKGQPLMEELRAEVLNDTLKKIETEGKKYNK